MIRKSCCKCYQDSAKEEAETLRLNVTSLEEEVDHLKEEVKKKAGEITRLGSEAEKKEAEIGKQRGEIETYKQKEEVSYLPYCPQRKH